MYCCVHVFPCLLFTSLSQGKPIHVSHGCTTFRTKAVSASKKICDFCPVCCLLATPIAWMFGTHLGSKKPLRCIQHDESLAEPPGMPSSEPSCCSLELGKQNRHWLLHWFLGQRIRSLAQNWSTQHTLIYVKGKWAETVVAKWLAFESWVKLDPKTQY